MDNLIVTLIIVSVIVCPIWALVWYFVFEIINGKRKPEEIRYAELPTKYFAYQFRLFLWDLKETTPYIIEIFICILPTVAYSVLFFIIMFTFIGDSPEGSLFTLYWFASIIFMAVAFFSIRPNIDTYTGKKRIFNALIEDARNYYSDFETNPETRKHVFEMISKFDFDKALRYGYQVTDYFEYEEEQAKAKAEEEEKETEEKESTGSNILNEMIQRATTPN